MVTYTFTKNEESETPTVEDVLEGSNAERALKTKIIAYLSVRFLKWWIYSTCLCDIKPATPGISAILPDGSTIISSS